MISQQMLKELFDYKDGHLYWKITKGQKKEGKIAGSLLRKYGNKTDYWRIGINGKNLKAHRLIWIYHYNYLPAMLDHIDGNGLNNKIENLRPTTPAQNVQNRKISPKNKCGIKGVSWDKNTKKWRAIINAFGKQIYVGRFIELKEAEQAINKARLQLHGQFARFQ
jgi:hypothetical protein